MPSLPSQTAPDTNGFGTLNVNCVPRCEAIAVDGVPRGPSPLVGFHLSSGTHTVLGVLNGSQNVRSVTVRNGNTTTLAFRGPQPEPNPFDVQ